MNAFGEPSPRWYRERRGEIQAFRTAYQVYLAKTLPLIQQGAPIPYDQVRSEVVRLATVAQRATESIGVRVGLAAPAQFPNTPPVLGLARVAFAHEDKFWQRPERPLTGGRYRTTYEELLDSLDEAEAIIDEREKYARRIIRRLDRLVRLSLGFPGYLISTLVGFDRRQLSDGPAKALWWLSVGADGATIFTLGRL